MDPQPHPLLAEASPSKSRAFARTATDWSHATTFLSTLYSTSNPTRIPQFERNPSTLRALLDLSAYNEQADQRVRLVREAEEEELRSLRQLTDSGVEKGEGEGKGELDIRSRLLALLKNGLDEKTNGALDDMAETSVLLACKPEATEIGAAMIQLTRREAELAQRAQRVQALQTQLDKEVSDIQSQLQDLQSSEEYKTPADLPTKTAEYNRSTKLLHTKTAEYTDRLASLSEKVCALPGPKVEDVKRREEDVLAARERVRRLEGGVRKFEGLPPDVEAARVIYQSLLDELREVEGAREALFGRLVS
jgi:HAUS augmin-like complex subunit 1